MFSEKSETRYLVSCLRAIDKVRPVQRSAGFQPAVSPISNRQRVASRAPCEYSSGLQAGSTAIQPVGNLRYDLVHRPAYPSHELYLKSKFDTVQRLANRSV